jgi:hypothetical protein
MSLEQAWNDLGKFVDWLGINPTGQDAIKAVLLVVFALVTLMILGDIYRGEIQNTLHRVRLIGNPTQDEHYRTSVQVPKRMVGSTLDGVFSNILIYYRYRDHRGRLKTKRLAGYRAKFRIRQTFAAATAVGHEADHQYTDDEKVLLAKELPDLEAPPHRDSEIVAMARSRVDYINALWEARMARADNLYGKLDQSAVGRFFHGVRKAELVQPEKVGLVMKFHFPINPYFLLYKHPETNVRSTAWLTVLTSLFAIFMQLVYAQKPRAPDQPEASLVRYESPASSTAQNPLRPPSRAN